MPQIAELEAEVAKLEAAIAKAKAALNADRAVKLQAKSQQPRADLAMLRRVQALVVQAQARAARAACCGCDLS